MPLISTNLSQAFKKTQEVPVIVGLKSTEFFRPFNKYLDIFKLRADFFNPLPFAQIILPRAILRTLSKLHFVRSITLDQQVFIPETDPLTSNLSIQQFKRIIKEKKFRPSPLRNVWPTGDSREHLEVQQAEQQGYTGKGITIAIIDTDYQKRSKQLISTISKNLIKWDILDSSGHGTHVASTCFGKSFITGDGFLLKGIAPDANGIMIKALAGPLGIGSISTVLKALQESLKFNPDIINLSLGTWPQENDPLVEAIDYLVSKDIIVVAAAGNTGPLSETIMSPGISEHVITVGALNKKGEIADFSARGPTIFGASKPDCIAPGETILSTVPKFSYSDFCDFRANGLSALDGTSMAAAHISGLLALLKQAGIITNAQDFQQLLKEKYPPKNPNTGHGLPKWSDLIK